MQQSCTYGSVRGGRSTGVPTATKQRQTAFGSFSLVTRRDRIAHPEGLYVGEYRPKCIFKKLKCSSP